MHFNFLTLATVLDW